METLEEVIVTTLVPIFIVVALAGMTWKWMDTRHTQRMAMIDKGMNPNEGTPRPAHPLGMLKWALLVTFVGVGLLLGIILIVNYNAVDEVAPVLSIIFGGIALLVYYHIAAGKLEGE